MLPLPTAYLAPISWYLAFASADTVVIDQHEHYVKQTYRNRCRIAMPDGPQDLVIPVQAASSHVPIRDIRLSDHGNWRHHHWSALRTAYGGSPFFEYYADDFAPFYHERRYTFLLDFNEALRELVCSLIDLDTSVVRSDRYLAPSFPVPSPNHPHPSLDHPHPSPNHPLPTQDHPLPTYYQVFRQRLGFLPDLSIADLLFNLGPESLLFLQKPVA